MQKQMNDRLILLQKKTDAILIQQVELAEYPIPRLFIVLPETPTKYDPANWFRTKFRLHFICECGEHTQPAGSKVVHHLHLAKHEGYLVREPTEFFKKYSPFLMLMLELIKFGSVIGGYVVPALATLKVVELVDSVQKSIETITAQIDYSLECIDKEMEKLRSSSLEELGDAKHHPLTHQDLTNYLDNVEGLEGTELRLLRSFLKTSNADNLVGNLYRMTTSDGHVKWVCHNHYRAGYQEANTQKLRDIVKLASGRFDEQLGTVEIKLQSSFAAVEFFGALVKAKGVLELIANFCWECFRKDVELLRDAIKKSMVAVLHVDLKKYQPSLVRTQLSSISARLEPLHQILEPVNLKSVHLILPEDVIKDFIFHSKKTYTPHRLTFELAIGVPSSYETCRVLAEIQKKNSSTTISLLHPIGKEGAHALSQSLRASLTLTSLDTSDSWIGEKAAHLLFEALRVNSTLIMLKIGLTGIGEKGVKALSEALKTNSTLTELDISYNSIGDKGAKAPSEALKTNSTLSSLKIWNNSIGDIGAQALSEALKANSTATTSNLMNNSIGDKGAQDLSEAPRANSTLSSLNLSNNSIGEKGAQALSEALKTNATLTTLHMGNNPLQVTGAQVLHDALKTNKTLTNLTTIVPTQAERSSAGVVRYKPTRR